MGLLDKLPDSTFGLKGEKPAIRDGALSTSTIHFKSSINNDPSIKRKPSDLDLNGEIPAGTYRERSPEGASF